MSDTPFPGRAEIEAGQMAMLRAMLEGLIPANRFYAAKLRQTDTAALNSLQEFFSQFPFTRKEELVEDQRTDPPYGTDLTFPIERYTRFSQTSGTAGAPLRWLDTTETWGWMIDNWVQVLLACDVTPADRIFFAFSFGPFLGFWTAFEAGVRLGCMCLPGGGMNTAGRLRVMLDNEVTVLCCTPTYAIRLGELAAEEGIDLSRSRVRKIIVAGEPGAGVPATRARIERMWPGARLRDHHGMTEVGPVTFECPAREGVLHVMENAFIPEVIDPATDDPVGPGNMGELVLTNLGRIGSPLIRYRTGDQVKRAASQQCACGRYEMALEGGILGRIDDMVVVRGVNIHPTAVEEIVRRFSAVAEYRVELCHSGPMLELNVHVEPMPDCADSIALGKEVEEALRTAFNLRMPVTTVPCGTLPRFELKATRWVRMDRPN